MYRNYSEKSRPQIRGGARNFSTGGGLFRRRGENTGGVWGCDTPQQIKLDYLQGNGILSQGINCRKLLRIQHIDVVMELVKHQVKFQKFNFGKQKSTTFIIIINNLF